MFKNINKKYKRIKITFYASLLVLVLIPVIFTLYQMGFLSPAPQVRIHNWAPENARVIKVVADYDFCPRSFYDENHNFSGLDIEVLNIVANELGYKVDIEFADWPECKAKMQNGEADLLLGLEIYSDISDVSKTIPISYDHICIYGRKKIPDVASLSGKNVAIIKNSVIKRLFELNCQYIEYETNTEILKAIESGKVDFGICHDSVANKIIEKENLNIEHCFILTESYPAIGVQKTDKTLLQEINRVLKHLSDDGTLHKLEVRWLEKFASNRSFSDIFYKYQFFYIFFYIVALIYIFFMAMVLVYVQSQIKVKKHYDILSSVAEIYMSMHFINLKDDVLEETLSTNENIAKIVASETSASKKMIKIMSTNAIPGDVEKALSFTDLSTVAQRLKSKKSISADFIGKNVGWFRCQFIAVSRDENNEVQSVVFTTQIIDDEKKREEELIYLSSVDELTRLFNRRAYEIDADGQNKNLMKDFVYLSFDLNGLKKLNDTEGHAAGDELIQGAAESLSMVFNPYGKVYRMGGDEFAAMIHADKESLDDLMDSLNKILNRWNGNYVKGISISSGVVMAVDYPGKSVEELAKIADDLMYAAKAEYYKTTGNKR